ncbi:MAG: FmdE family protein [Candidatus Helarchaeota archaeon]
MNKIPEDLKELVKFHGHLCPGLVIGYRVAKLAKEKLNLNRSPDEELVAIVENDSCAVDAIQFINGTTFGKGNLIFKDHGLQAYTFIERKSNKQIRIELKADVFDDSSTEREKILEKMNKNEKLTDEEILIIKKIRMNTIDQMLSLTDDNLFNIIKVNVEIPQKAMIFKSIKCSNCGLLVMETRARLLNKKTYCIPCWKKELGLN